MFLPLRTLFLFSVHPLCFSSQFLLLGFSIPSSFFCQYWLLFTTDYVFLSISAPVFKFCINKQSTGISVPFRAAENYKHARALKLIKKTTTIQNYHLDKRQGISTTDFQKVVIKVLT